MTVILKYLYELNSSDLTESLRGRHMEFPWCHALIKKTTGLKKKKEEEDNWININNTLLTTEIKSLKRKKSKETKKAHLRQISP